MSLESSLHSILFFQGLTDEELAQLAGIGQTRDAAAQDVVFSEGDEADALYVLLSGQVRVYGRDEEGNEAEFTTLNEGEFFGEMALLDGKPRSATVACVDPCGFFILGRADFLHLLTESEHLLADLLAELSNRIRGTSEKYFWNLLKKQRFKAEVELERHRSLSQMVAGVAQL